MKQAKKINMKKLKSAVWECLTDGKSDYTQNEQVKYIV